MTRAPSRFGSRFPLAALATACSILLLPPQVANAGQGPQGPARAAAGQGTVIVQRVENGPLFGIEFKFTEMDRQDVYLLGGYAGFIFDDTFFIGGAGYWQVDDYWNHDGYWDYDDYYDGGCYYGCGGYYGPYHANGYGGLLLEWYGLRSPVVSLSARGLIGGGVATVGWNDYVYIEPPSPRHGPGYPPPGGYYSYDQGYFVFEPQVNVSVRIAPHVAMVGGVGYRVVGWANGWQDQIQGLTATFAVRIGGR